MTSTALSARTPETRPDPQADTSSDVTASLPALTGGREAWESLFVSCLATIDSIVGTLARRRRLSADDAADLASTVRLRMMVDDYAILRKFQGRSSLRTYLTVVIHRLYLDEQVARLGKWRPSRQARREGPTAVLFERLTKRDGLTFESACAALEIDHGLRIERTPLERLYSTVRRSPPRRFIPADRSVEDIPSTMDSPDEQLDMAERVALAERARGALVRAVASLTKQDRRILQLRFARGLSVADIAREMGLKQKTLYVRCGQLLKTLRSRLEDDGLVEREILNVIGRTDL